MREVRTGEIYRHFKGNLYQIVAVASHSETNEKYVVYQALYGDMQVWVRPYAMFVDEVDKRKYPQAGQRYRFELLNTLASDGCPKAAAPGRIMQEGEVRKEPEQKEAYKAPEPEQQQRQGAYKDQKQEDMEQADERLINFLDARTCQDKINYLTLIRNNIDDRLIDDIAAAMDIAVDEGPLDERYYSLRSCLITKAKYECGRR